MVKTAHDNRTDKVTVTNTNTTILYPLNYTL